MTFVFLSFTKFVSSLSVTSIITITGMLNSLNGCFTFIGLQSVITRVLIGGCDSGKKWCQVFVMQ